MSNGDADFPMMSMNVFHIEIFAKCKREVLVLIAETNARAISKALKYGGSPIIKSGPIPVTSYWKQS